mgnify:CR=1 FL=1
MNFPEELRYSSDHEWLKVEGSVAYVGVTDFAQSELGEIVFLDIPTEGESLSKGDVFGSIEAVKTVSDLMIPISGTVVEFNDELEDNPELVNEDPYGKGWIVKIEIADASEIDELLSAADYKKLIGK